MAGAGDGHSRLVRHKDLCLRPEGRGLAAGVVVVDVALPDTSVVCVGVLCGGERSINEGSLTYFGVNMKLLG